MQERVLGALIIGGVALVGVAWALISGIPPLVNARQNESDFENALLAKVNADYDDTVTNLDVRRVTYATETVTVTNKFGGEDQKLFAVISLEGYNNKDEIFMCKLRAPNSYILDLQNKLTSNSSTAAEALKYDIYQNYTMTTSKLLLEVFNDSSTEFGGYYIGDQTYGRLFSNEGTKISSVGDPEVSNGMKNKPYSVDELCALGSSTSSEVYSYGTISTDPEKTTSENGYDLYSFYLCSDDGTVEQRVKVENIILGTGVDSISRGETVLIQSPVIIDGENVTIAGDNCKVYSVGEPDRLSLLATPVQKVDNEVVKDLKYGELSDNYYYVYGVISSVEEVSTDSTTNQSYNIRIVTEGRESDFYFEVYNATFDKTNVSAQDIKAGLKEGDTIVAYGQVTANMHYAAK